MFDDSINEIHRAMDDESRSARRSLTEVQRAQSCGHTGARAWPCAECGEDPR